MYNYINTMGGDALMRKSYMQPQAEIFSLSSLDDFLLGSPGLDDGEDDNEMGESSGNIKPDRPGIWG